MNFGNHENISKTTEDAPKEIENALDPIHGYRQTNGPSDFGRRVYWAVNDPYTQKKYLRIVINPINTFLEWLQIVLTLSFLILLAFIVFNGHFEDVKFNDGTELTCTLNGLTGVIK